MGYRKCKECNGKGYHLVEITNFYALLENNIPFMREGKMAVHCKKCTGEGFQGPSFK